MSKRLHRSPLGPVLLGTAAAVMVGLLFYGRLMTKPDVVYIVGVLASAGVTGWAALECLFSDWERRGLRERVPGVNTAAEEGLRRLAGEPRPAHVTRVADGIGLSAWWGPDRACMTTFSQWGRLILQNLKVYNAAKLSEVMTDLSGTMTKDPAHITKGE